MIANARMYSVSPEAAALWRSLLATLLKNAGFDAEVIEHTEPAPIAELWSRTDKAAVFMCGLPLSLTAPRPSLIAAPVPSPHEYRGEATYWSDLVVRDESRFQDLRDAFGHRIAFTTADSQSGYAAALTYFMKVADRFPLFSEVVAPQMTPLGALRAVIDGSADIAPIDSYAFALLKQFRPDLTSRVRTVASSAATPIPPLIASPQVPHLAKLRTAFAEADRHETTRDLMQKLLLRRFAQPDIAAYDVLQSDFEIAQRFWTEHPLAASIHPAFIR